MSKVDHVKVALDMLAKERKDEMRGNARTYLALASVALAEQRSDDRPTYQDTRPVGAHKFKPGDRAIGRPVKLGRKNRADRRAARAASS